MKIANVSDTHVQLLGTLGFAAKGSVYLVMGALAALWAFGEGGKITDGKGVVYEIAELPGGRLLLVALATGLTAYAALRLLQAFRPNYSEDAASLGKRAGRFASGVVHAVLAYTCIEALNLVASSGGSGKKTMVGNVLAADGGRYLVMVVGGAIIAAGVVQLYKAATNEVEDELTSGSMPASIEEWMLGLARFGLSARALVFFIVGGFLISAGLKASSAETKTTGDALRVIAHQTYGTFLLTIVALGLVAYGAYMLASARYHRFAI